MTREDIDQMTQEELDRNLKAHGLQDLPDGVDKAELLKSVVFIEPEELA